jgi:hypothetical protein
MVFPVGGNAVASYSVKNSVRFSKDNSSYLYRTPGVAGTRRKFTLSVWVKRNKFGHATSTSIMSAYSGNSDSGYLTLGFTADDRLMVSGYASNWRWTSRYFRDPTAWVHLVFRIDTTIVSPASDRIKVYVNGTEETAFDISNNPSQDFDFPFCSTAPHNIGRADPAAGAADYADLQLAEVIFVDGQALDPSNFSETNSTTGMYVPKRYTGTYGTTGFRLDFFDDTAASSSALGKDRSGNNNDWSMNGISVGTSSQDVDADVLSDSPTVYSDGVYGRGNACTWNSLQKPANITFGPGNLKVTKSSASDTPSVIGTQSRNAGKWFWEVNITALSGIAYVGVTKIPNSQLPAGRFCDNSNEGFGYRSDGQKETGGVAAAYGVSYTVGDTVGVALDMDTGSVTFYKNGASQGSAYTGLTGDWAPAFSIGSASNSFTIKANFGQRVFKYSVPGSHLALNSFNIPTPSIPKSNVHMDAYAYAGTGASNAIAALQFQPDIVWIKQRSSPADAHAIYDSGRGTTIELDLTTAVEATVAQGLTAFGANGFTVGTDGGVNESALNFVSWNFRANGAGSANAVGTISSTVSANTTAGIAHVRYTGSGANGTVGHGLGKAPAFVIVKRRNVATSSWAVYHKDMNATPQAGRLLLDTTGAYAAASDLWNSTAPTTTVFSVGTNAASNTSASAYLAYLFAEIEGFSKFGKYVGNGSSDGPVVWCGFAPEFILIKEAAGTNAATASWVMYDAVRDTINPISSRLFANLSDAEVSDSSVEIDVLSTGFKPRVSNFNVNESSGTYIFAAFAKQPFKYARAA